MIKEQAENLSIVAPLTVPDSVLDVTGLEIYSEDRVWDFSKYNVTKTFEYKISDMVWWYPELDRSKITVIQTPFSYITNITSDVEETKDDK